MRVIRVITDVVDPAIARVGASAAGALIDAACHLGQALQGDCEAAPIVNFGIHCYGYQPPAYQEVWVD